MKVKELVELLNDCDAEAHIVFTIQPNWPLEYEIAGLATRYDCRSEWGPIRTGPNQNPTDVLLVEGNQLGLGEREAWSAARARRRRR